MQRSTNIPCGSTNRTLSFMRENAPKIAGMVATTLIPTTAGQADHMGNHADGEKNVMLILLVLLGGGVAITCGVSICILLLLRCLDRNQRGINNRTEADNLLPTRMPAGRVSIRFHQRDSARNSAGVQQTPTYATNQLISQPEEQKTNEEKYKALPENIRNENSPENDFLCPITQQIMNDPVVASDGYSYERSAILAWCKEKNTSPMTREELGSVFYPNRLLKSKIMEFLEASERQSKEQYPSRTLRS